MTVQLFKLAPAAAISFTIAAISQMGCRNQPAATSSPTANNPQQESSLAPSKLASPGADAADRLLVFDHVFAGLVDSPDDFTDLAKLGFTLGANTTDHPGTQTCRFVYFRGRSNVRDPVYAEYCMVADEAAFDATYEADVPRWIRRGPAVSFAVSSNLAQFTTELRDAHPDLELELSHRNYDWKENKDPNAPGWNFLHFAEPLLDQTDVWLTEYEPRPDPQKREESEVHANTTRHILGFVHLSDGVAGEMPITQLPGVEEQQGVVVFNDGTKIWILQANRKEHPAFREKEFALAAIVSEFNHWRRQRSTCRTRNQSSLPACEACSISGLRRHQI